MTKEPKCGATPADPGLRRAEAAGDPAATHAEPGYSLTLAVVW